MGASLHATIVALRHLEDELSLARSKPSRQALDTLAQVVRNVRGARERLHRAASQDEDPSRRAQLTRAVAHIDGALDAARLALTHGPDDELRNRMTEIVDHLVIATTCADGA